MNEFETVKHIMMINHVSYDDLSARLGYKSKSTSYITLDHKHIYVDTWRRFLEELGYEIVVRPKNGKGSEYVIDNDNTPSPLRFHDMNLNLESILSGTPTLPKKKPALTIGERNLRSEELKKRIGEISFAECDDELREIWSMKDPLPNGKLPYNEHEQEYERYKKELAKLYNEKITPTPKKRSAKYHNIVDDVPPVIISTGAHGKIITEDTFVENDISASSVMDRAKAKQKAQSNILAALVADFQMDD